MTFKEWCFEVLGIVEFTEGKILNCVLIPALADRTITMSPLVEEAGGRCFNIPYHGVIIIPFDNYQCLLNQLQGIYWTTNLLQQSFELWLNNYFLLMGVDLIRLREYKDFSSIHLTFSSPQSQFNFISQYNYLDPLISYNPILQTESLQVPATVIWHLLGAYYKSPRAEIKQVQNESVMQNHLNHLHRLKQLIVDYQLQSRLDQSMMLARDFSNHIKNGIKLETPQAASAYSLSLKIYAEVNRDNLAQFQYDGLKYAASLLAAYTPEGKLQQSLKTDAKFVKYLDQQLLSTFSSPILMEYPVLRTLSGEVQCLAFSLIEQNLNAMLYGCPFICVSDNSYISMPRFFPGREMQSDTDELIFQGGGMRGHSSVFRIIKVGYLADGTRAGFNEKPSFYEYFKIEDNLGIGPYEVNPFEKTCTGTYVTQLEPLIFENGVYSKSKLDPRSQPLEYQQAMEFTLKELIRVERQLKLYRKPALMRSDTSFSIPGSDEANEWTRLNDLRQLLSGISYSFPLEYYSQDPLNPSKRYRRTVCNRRHFYQEGGSCTIFSLKSLVNSVIGSELMALHSNFMQLSDSKQHIHWIDSKVELLQFYLARFNKSRSVGNTVETRVTEREEITALPDLAVRNRVSFFNPNQSESVHPSDKEINDPSVTTYRI
ncbi:hypothetical protein Lmor_2827 [Legionella moravica]|uniref:Uncharacterized protein n=1 Tax=Legionella moravica TaxID=39962 RepID=A0A378JYG6_9GAMM|nr:hypothetical protein [Legionella moravica]KTD30720.1 hypothetical protein Lmor_2827 [Legionella moravica]STX63456.1 Uncharacterised protein [Legionella moravica]